MFFKLLSNFFGLLPEQLNIICLGPLFRNLNTVNEWMSSSYSSQNIFHKNESHPIVSLHFMQEGRRYNLFRQPLEISFSCAAIACKCSLHKESRFRSTHRGRLLAGRRYLSLSSAHSHQSAGTTLHTYFADLTKTATETQKERQLLPFG